MVQFLQSMDLTGFSDLRGSVPTWTLNVPAHAQCVLTRQFLCVAFWQTSPSVMHTHNGNILMNTLCRRETELHLLITSSLTLPDIKKA